MGLWTPEDGYALACKLIEKEKREQTGFLNLGGISLRRMPDSVFELSHLRTLVLSQWRGGGSLWEQSNADDLRRPMNRHLTGDFIAYDTVFSEAMLRDLGATLRELVSLSVELSEGFGLEFIGSFPLLEGLHMENA